MSCDRTDNRFQGRRCSRCGFSLSDLLVTLAALGLLVWLLPALAGARSQSKKIVCQAQLGRIGVIWLSYADDYEDALPPQINSAWTSIIDFMHDELDNRDVNNGEIFYCPDSVMPINPETGQPYDWYNSQAGGFTGIYKWYATGYNIFTNVLQWKEWALPPEAPENIPWVNADGAEDYGGGSWHYYWRAADPEYQDIIPVAESTEREHVTNIWSDYKRHIIIPAAAPMIFDQVVSFFAFPDSFIFSKENCNHINPAKETPYCLNAVYLDGHVSSHGADEMAVLRNRNPYGQIWF